MLEAFVNTIVAAPAAVRRLRLGSQNQSYPVSLNKSWARYMSEVSMNASVPAGTEIARPFLPAKDFDLSKRFYEALGFTKVLDGEVAIFRIGASGFILQKYFQKEWAENFMMQLMVDDLDSWWTRLSSLALPTRFGVPEPKPPAVQPWGLRIAYVIDPSGVLWHVAQRRPDTSHDV